MKKIILLFCLVAFFTTVTHSQGFQGFFKPIDDGLFSQTGVKALNPSIWLFRPTVEISALQLNWNKTEKKFDTSSLQSTGPGISYSHFIEVNELPYNNFSINGLLLFGIQPGETIQTTISGAVTISALEFVNIGTGYNFTLKIPFILTGVTLSF